MKKILPYIKGTFVIIVAFIAYGNLMYLFSIPQKNDVGSPYFIIISGMSIALAILGIFIMWSAYVTQLKRKNPRDMSIKFHFNWEKIVLALIGFAVSFGISWVVSWLTGFTLPENEVSVNETLANASPLFFLMVTFFGPIFEEIIFRGYLVNLLLRKDTRLNRLIVIVIGGLLFGFLHETHLNLYFLDYSSAGAIFTAIYIYTKDLRYSMLAHIINNILSSI